MEDSDRMAKAIVDLPETPAINARWLEEMQHPEFLPEHRQAQTGSMLSYGLEAAAGSFGSFVPYLMKIAPKTGPTLETLAEDAGDCAEAVAKGVIAGTAVAGLDMLGQRLTDHDVAGHDLFRPTGLEALGIGAAAAAPIDLRAKLAFAGFAWLAGRVENYFET